MAAAALLLLADGRFPAGGHAHSGGAEAACRSGAVHDAATMAAFLGARLRTVGLTGAALAAAACGIAGERELLSLLAELDEAADARTPSAAQRGVSRKLGRQLLRAARAAWPHEVLERLAEWYPGGVHQPLALGITGWVAGLGPVEVAVVSAYESVNGPATACVRLLGLDPYQVAAELARLAPEVDAVAARATAAAEAALRGGMAPPGAASAPAGTGAAPAGAATVPVGNTHAVVDAASAAGAAAAPAVPPGGPYRISAAAWPSDGSPPASVLALREGLVLLPAASAPLLDIHAEQHSSWKVRLFAS